MKLFNPLFNYFQNRNYFEIKRSMDTQYQQQNQQQQQQQQLFQPEFLTKISITAFWEQKFGDYYTAIFDLPAHIDIPKLCKWLRKDLSVPGQHVTSCEIPKGYIKLKGDVRFKVKNYLLLKKIVPSEDYINLITSI